MACDITAQPKQGRRASPMSSLCILLCLRPYPNNARKKFVSPFVNTLNNILVGVNTVYGAPYFNVPGHCRYAECRGAVRFNTNRKIRSSGRSG